MDFLRDLQHRIRACLDSIGREEAAMREMAALCDTIPQIEQEQISRSASRSRKRRGHPDTDKDMEREKAALEEQLVKKKDVIEDLRFTLHTLEAQERDLREQLSR